MDKDEFRQRSACSPVRFLFLFKSDNINFSKFHAFKAAQKKLGKFVFPLPKRQSCFSQRQRPMMILKEKCFAAGLEKRQKPRDLIGRIGSGVLVISAIPLRR